MPTGMTIDGGTVSGDGTFPVVDPALGTPFAEAPECPPAALDRAVDSARRAQAGWAVDEDARLDALERLANALTDTTDELAELLSTEQGKPLAAARYEVGETARWVRAAAALPLEDERVRASAGVDVTLRRRPLGVVAAITPWNFPLLLAGWKIGPALRAGNTMVLKPSPYTPMSTLRLGEIAAGVLPPGVLNVVSGGDGLGARLTTHPDVAKISFTGSVATGRKVLAASASQFARITLELGGNDAAIVLDDVDPAVVGKGLFWGAFINCGQICAGIKRILVPESLHDAIVEELVTRARRVRVGNGRSPGVQLGPIQNRAQYERVSGLVDDALVQGATAAAGGGPAEGPGYFFRPTVLTGARDDMRVVAEEQFGPVLPVLTYRTVEEAVARANATSFGLSGSVWSCDPDRAAAVADRLEVGTAFVNDHLALSPDIPFGGAKSSGIGVENGRWGLEDFTRVQVLHRPA